MKKVVYLVAALAVATSIASAQWLQQQSGVTCTLIGVRFTSRLNGWAVGQNGTMLRTTDGGASWNQVASPLSGDLDKICFVDSAKGWIVGAYNTILSTTDGGDSWQQNIDNSPYSGNYYAVSCTNVNSKTECWLGGGHAPDGYNIIEKANGYGQWYPQIIGFAGRLTGIYFLNDSLGWATGDSNLILSTKNGGLWWNQGTLPALPPHPYYQGLCDVKFFSPEVGLCVGNADVIMKSTDGGASWKVVQLYPYSMGILFRAFIVNDSVAYAVGDTSASGAGIIEKSTDVGDTWISQHVSAPVGYDAHFEDICFVSDSEGWAVGGNGVIVHTTNGGDSTGDSMATSVNPKIQIYNFNLKQNYPNPFNPTTAINYSLAKTSLVTLKVYDVLGREVKTLVNEQENAGDHSLSFDATSLPSGVYFYRLQAGTNIQTKKLTLVK